MARIRKVNTDLMGPSSGQTTFDQGDGGLIGFDQFKSCQRDLAPTANNGHALTVPLVATDTAVELALGGQQPQASAR